MMIERIVRARCRDEDGVAMLIAVVLLTVISTLTLMSLSVAGHVDKSTNRGRHRTQALHVAESGIEAAIARIEAAAGVFSGAVTGTTEEGNYRVVVTRLARNTYRLDATGGVRSDYDAGSGKWIDRQIGSHRSIQVTVAPPRSFNSALFSYTTLDLKNNDNVIGDVWANQNVVLQANTSVSGSVTAATGYVILDGPVGGDVRSGGFNPATDKAIVIDATVGGNVKASVVDPPDPLTCGGADQNRYAVQVGATVSGGLTTWGQKTGSGTVLGAMQQNTCTSAPATIPMPTFSYNASNYDPTTLHEYGTPTTPSPTAVADFYAYLAANLTDMRGTFYVNQSSPVNQDNRLDLSGMIITGDLTIISNTPIYSAAVGDSSADAVVMIGSTYDPPTGTSCDTNHDTSECAVHLKNQFSVSGSVAVLVWAPYGPTAVKNNALQYGAIYSDSIEIKNNQTITYDPRVDRIVGFGPVTLEVTRWLELNAA